MASTSLKDFSWLDTASLAFIHSTVELASTVEEASGAGKENAGFLEEFADCAHHVAAGESDVVRSHMLSPGLG
ncbi:hypothetical protein StoSoilB13_21960 [Arthrobacter sp. StoSoilB13]|nr:hypothetical protein StoSoilB13_21960 [Arthrobacter sp. StoSoilB13]